MAAWVAAGEWRPFFPGAQVLVSRREHDAIVGEGPYRPDGSEALEALHAQGAVTLVDDEHEVTAEVTVRWTGAHSPGHSVVHVKSDGAEATMVGHLALSPIHAALDGCPLHEDPAAAHARLRALRDRGSPLVGPLWPAPGAARWTGTVMEPVPSGDR
jgi:glyoxylase-like metal-dependent hydrolase (beta-lactamase superfamily II)